jgi:hypothetical protein
MTSFPRPRLQNSIPDGSSPVLSGQKASKSIKKKETQSKRESGFQKQLAGSGNIKDQARSDQCMCSSGSFVFYTGWPDSLVHEYQNLKAIAIKNAPKPIIEVVIKGLNQ